MNTKNRRTDVEVRAAVFFTYPATLPMLKRMCRTAAVREAFDRLDYREKAILSDRLGFCPDCWSIQGTKQKTFIDLAAEHMISPTTAERIYHGALKKLRRACVDCE